MVAHASKTHKRIFSALCGLGMDLNLQNADVYCKMIYEKRGNATMDEPIFTVNFKELPLSDDFMFGEVMRRPHICKLFLEALLERPIARIEYISKQEDISDSYTSHGIRLDVYLKDEASTVYSIEMQTQTGSFLLKRIRYYQGAIDRHNLTRGRHYTLLPQSFIIMICTKDPFGCGLALYKRRSSWKAARISRMTTDLMYTF